MTMYYDGRPCRKCGGTRRLASNRHCVPCHNIETSRAARPEHFKLKDARRRELLKMPLSPKDREDVKSIYVDAKLLNELTGIKHHVDHILPVSKGGPTHADNLRPLTEPANLEKKDHYDPDEEYSLWPDSLPRMMVPSWHPTNTQITSSDV